MQDVKVRPLKGVVVCLLSAARGEEEPVSGPGAAPEPAPRRGHVSPLSSSSVDCVVSPS